ncbi:MAG: type II toxin-antitoxin system RelE/ParE family toxin [Sulfuricurvum sp.]|nr:type II toxin-antitoxin system RelE/ParE family toxin [Sulfuricurvum sp.]
MSKKFTVFWTQTAENDFIFILEYIKKDSLKNAQTVFGVIKEQALKLNTFPERGRVVPELQEFGITQYREIIIQRWRMIYKIVDERVYIVSLIDARQNGEDILFNRYVRG